jgi:hypothetical protein
MPCATAAKLLLFAVSQRLTRHTSSSMPGNFSRARDFAVPFSKPRQRHDYTFDPTRNFERSLARETRSEVRAVMTLTRLPRNTTLALVRIVYWIRRHPLLSTCICFFVSGLPQWVSAIWSLFHYDEPFIPWMMRHSFPTLAFSPWFITVPLGLMMFAAVIFIQIKTPFISSKGLSELQKRHAKTLLSHEFDRADANVKTFDRRVTEVETVINWNLPLLRMLDRVGLPATRENTGTLSYEMKRIEVIEQELIDQAYAIDREMTWPTYRQMGIDAVHLNASITEYVTLADERLSHRILREVEMIRKHVVVIARERCERESASSSALC